MTRPVEILGFSYGPSQENNTEMSREILSHNLSQRVPLGGRCTSLRGVGGSTDKYLKKLIICHAAFKRAASLCGQSKNEGMFSNDFLKNEPFSVLQIRNSMHINALISYVTPFISTNHLGKNRLKASDIHTKEDAIIHDNMCSLRNKSVAHEDGSTALVLNIAVMASDNSCREVIPYCSKPMLKDMEGDFIEKLERLATIAARWAYNELTLHMTTACSAVNSLDSAFRTSMHDAMEAKNDSHVLKCNSDGTLYFGIKANQSKQHPKNN